MILPIVLAAAQQPKADPQVAATPAPGLRERLEQKGFTFGGGILFDASSPAGIDTRRRGTTRALFELNMLLSSEPLLGYQGGSLLVDGFALVGPDANRDLGSLLGVTTLDAEEVMQIGELWYEQTFSDQELRLKFGKIDALNEFAVMEMAELFPELSVTWSPAFLGQPTFPDSATGVLGFWNPGESWYLGVGMFDGATQDGVRTGTRGPSTFFRNHKSDSYYWVGELGCRFMPWNRAARLAIGGFHHSGRFDRFDGGTVRGATGGYLILEQQLMREEDPEQGLDLSLRVAATEEDIAPVHRHHTVALNYTGLLGGRDLDVVGLQWNVGQTSRVGGSPFVRDEHQVGAFYRYQVTPCLHVQPALIYYKHPGGDGAKSDELVALLRVEFTF